MTDHWLQRPKARVLIALALGLAPFAGALQADAPQADAAVEKARTALGRGDGIAAEVLLKEALAAGADKAQVAALMGEALLDQGQMERARGWLGPGQFQSADAAYGWRLLGQLEMSQGNLVAAGKAFDQSLLADSRDPLTWTMIARLRYLGGQQVQAVEAAERALKLGPDNVRALELRAQLLRNQAGFAAALPLYEHGLELAPDDLSLLAGYAGCLGELGRTVEMLAVTRHMITVAPKDPQAWFLQAVMAARAGRISLARSLLQRAGAPLQNVPSALLLQGTLELEAGNANLAATALQRLADLQPANARIDLLLAHALYRAGLLDELFTRFAAKAARADAPVYLLQILARAYEDRGDRAAAATLLDRARGSTATPTMPIAERAPLDILGSRWRDDPGSAVSAAPYVRALLASGNKAEAQRVVEQVLRLQPGSAVALELAGDVALAQGRSTAALQLYGQATQVWFPDRLVLRTGEALSEAGQAPPARRLVVNYLAAFPGSRLAARLAASQAAYAGEWDRAAAVLDNLRIRGGNRDVRLLTDLSLAQLRSGDSDSALTNAVRAARLQPASGVAAQAQAMALVAMRRNLPLAAQLANKARSIDGDNPLLAATRAKLAKLQR